MALVNGHVLNPGQCQVVAHRVERQFPKVVYNCPNFEDAQLSLKHLLDDPRDVLQHTVRFEILDHEGNLVCGETYSSTFNRLKGEELGVERLLDRFGYNRAVREPLIKSVLTYFLVCIIRAIYHLFFVSLYCLYLGAFLGIPLISVLSLLLVYYWIVDFVRGLTH